MLGKDLAPRATDRWIAGSDWQRPAYHCSHRPPPLRQTSSFALQNFKCRMPRGRVLRRLLSECSQSRVSRSTRPQRSVMLSCFRARAAEQRLDCPIISVAEDCATNLTSIAAARSVVTDKHRGARGTSSARQAARGRVPSVAHHAETKKGNYAHASYIFIETQNPHRENRHAIKLNSCWGKTWPTGQRTDG